MSSNSFDDLIKNDKKHQETIDGLKNILGVDKIDEIIKQNKENSESINKIQTTLEKLSEKIDKNETAIAKDNSDSSTKNSRLDVTKGRSAWFALLAVGAMMTGAAIFGYEQICDPQNNCVIKTIFEDDFFQTIVSALVAYATGRTIVNEYRKNKESSSKN